MITSLIKFHNVTSYLCLLILIFIVIFDSSISSTDKLIISLQVIVLMQLLGDKIKIANPNK